MADVKTENPISDVMEKSRESPISKDSSAKILKIVLKNFLSFKEEEVDLSPEFTVITGPNGAGKSTIYQAIKFVLGSNDYDGRYKKWADFIHTGEKYAAVLMEITFNSKVYRIQRTVFTDQAPKLMIQTPEDNKLRTARVDDLDHLIQTIKIDPSNIFSFMSQGNIDQIKDFKEPVLCSFVEKGIGLTTLRENIILQKDRIAELGRQSEVLMARKDNCSQKIRALEPKLKRLEKKHELLNKLADLQDELLWTQKDEIQKQISQTQADITTQTTERQALLTQSEQIDVQITEKKSDFERLLSQQQELYTQISEKQARIKVINQEIQKMTDAKSQIATKIDTYTTELEKLDQQLKSTSVQLQNVEIQLTQIQDHFQAENQQLSNLETEERGLIHEFQSYQKILLDYQSKSQLITQKQELIAKYQEDKQEIEEEIQNKVKDIDRLRHELEHFEWFMKDPRSNLKEQLEQKAQKTNDTLDQLQDLLQHLDKDYNEKTDQMERVKKSIISKDMPRPKEVQTMLDEIRSRKLAIVGPIIDYLSFDDMFQQAIESIFGEWSLYGFVARDRETFAQLKDIAFRANSRYNLYLEQPESIQEFSKVAGDTSTGIFGYLVSKIRILNDSISVKKVVYSLVGDTIVVKDHIVGTDYIQRYHFQGRIITLEGEQIRSKRYVVEARPFFQKNKIKIGSVAKAKEIMAKLETECEQNRAEYNETRQKVVQFEHLNEALTKRLQDIPKLLTQYKQMEIATNTKNAKIQKREKIFQQITAFNQEITQLTIEKEEIQKQLPAETFSKQTRLNAIPALITDVKTRIIQYQKSKDGYESQRNSFQSDQIKAKTEQELKTNLKKDLEGQLQSQDASFYQLFQEHIQLKKEVEKLNLQHTALKDQSQSLLQTLESLNSSKNAFQNQIALKQQTIVQYELVLLEKQTKMNQIIIRMKSTQHNSAKVRPIAQIESDIGTINSVLCNYYDVDDGLLTEKRDAEETILRILQKYGELVQEIELAKQAHKELEETYYSRFNTKIQELQTTMNDMFANIKLTAKVRLELTGDIQSLGLRIHPTIASNNEYPLHALSGGQRSMVGICLMLALNKLNPSPFSMYDEIEMFLDPENAQNVARLIHLLAKRGNQFILLMPDKSKTLIQIADKVIGVTRNGKTGPSTIFYGIPPSATI